MKLKSVSIRNFRRLENVEIDIEEKETVFVGPNNSGKTSATTALGLFLSNGTFKIHDFSVPKIKEIDNFGAQNETQNDLPSLELDLWFSIDEDVEYGRVCSLLPSVSSTFQEVGIRLKYSAKDPDDLRYKYRTAYRSIDGNEYSKKLSHFLSLPDNLRSHFKMEYFSLEKANDDILESVIEPEEGKRILKTLIRVDFLDAQRNIDDQETTSRSNRLSSAFAAYYKRNLEQAEIKDEANAVIDQNNISLTTHYQTHFEGLMNVIKSLGVPSINDRILQIVSTLNPEEALRGNTDLRYVDLESDHELPEAYNGLGFKNLIYMAVQISHFHKQWINTEENRPACQMIFIEEPEAHLHAQVQQTFIKNIWHILEQESELAEESHMIPQIGITTHSSHILDTVEFEKVRYFQRCKSLGDLEEKKTLNASNVLNLESYNPNTGQGNEAETLRILKRYLRLTHCDLFFSDAAILVEGTVEKLLLPAMVDKVAEKLNQNYLTILELGGAYSHRFSDLINFLGIPCLIITDLDSVLKNDSTGRYSKCRADAQGAVSSNASIKFFLKKCSVSELIKCDFEEQKLENDTCCICFQKGSQAKGFHEVLIGRTLEEAFILENLQLFQKGDLKINDPRISSAEHNDIHQAVYDFVDRSSFKKTEFALDVATNLEKWKVPKYIEDGLCWLDLKLNPDKEGTEDG